MHRHGTLPGSDALEEKHRRHTQHTQKRQHAEIVDVRQHHRLSGHHPLNHTVSLLALDRSTSGHHVC